MGRIPSAPSVTIRISPDLSSPSVIVVDRLSQEG